MKRLFDIAISASLMIVTAPIVLVMLAAIWLHDHHSPLYRAKRVGLGNRDFAMLKIRSMRVDADKSGVNSTSIADSRILPLGRYLRLLKLDELPQLWNVLKGQMSLVGPRPNTRAAGVDLYTDEEMRLLSVPPGITDLASIVFSDEGEILNGSEDPDGVYNRLIRPWKSQLGLLYIDNRSLRLDLKILCLTALALVSRQAALAGVVRILERLKADTRLVEVCRRVGPLPAGWRLSQTSQR